MRYRIEKADGSVIIFNTEKSEWNWEEERDWNGQNYIGRSSGSQWVWKTLYESSKNNYFLVTSSQWQGSKPYAELLSKKEAALFLLVNDYELPSDLKSAAAEIEE